MDRKKRNIFKISILILILIILIAIPFNYKKVSPHQFIPQPFAGDTLNCYVMIDKSLGAKGHPLGYIYELANEFEKEQKCKINLSHNPDNLDSAWNNLMDGSLDLLIINAIKDTVPDQLQEYVIASIPINANDDVFVAKKENFNLIQVLNFWLSSFQSTPEYQGISQTFYKKRRGFISPYDKFIKENAGIVGWDWKLLSALIYQESKFKMGLISSRGAIGLMQIKESVARHYGIDNIYTPENNIKAGVLHLRDIQKRYQRMGADSLDLIKLTLAGYNAGIGRVDDIMALASQNGKDPLVWDNLVATIPLMQQKEYYTNPLLKHGKFKGDETINFVDQILDKYEYYNNNY